MTPDRPDDLDDLDGLPPVQREAREAIAEAERLLDAADYGDDLLRAVATLRMLEQEFGLLVMLPPGDDWTDRYDVVLQTWKELRVTWRDGEVSYRPPITKVPTEALVEDLRAARRRMNGCPEDQEVGALYDSLVREAERRGLNVTRAER